MMRAQDKWGEYSIDWGSLNYVVYEECGDTSINDTFYQKVLRSRYIRRQNHQKRSSQLYALTRKQGDSILYKRVWSAEQIDKSEKLLYDFGVHSGDTLTISTPYDGIQDFHIYHVDTFFVFEQPYKRIFLRQIGEGYEDIWIEKIGSIRWGYFSRGQSNNVIDAGTIFNEYYSSKHQKILEGDWRPFPLMSQIELNCYGTPNDIRATIRAFPNPFSDHIQFVQIPANATIVISNLLGQEIVSYHANNHSFRIQTTSIQTGIYMISVYHQGSLVERFKILKI